MRLHLYRLCEPDTCLIVGMTNPPADLVEPGVVHSHGDGHINLWPWSGEDKSVARDIAETFQQAGLPCRADPEVQIAIWEKVAFNAALNSVCAITRQTVGGVGDSEYGRRLTAAVIRETVEVANALGVVAQASRVEHAVNHAFANLHHHKPGVA